MNIAHVVFSFNNGGIENLIVDIINNWNEEDSVLLCIVNDSKNDLLIKKIRQSTKKKVVCLNRPIGGKKIDFLKKLNDVLDNFNTDIVHCHSNNMFKFCIPIKVLHPNWKMYLTIHDKNIYKDLSKLDVLLHYIFLRKIIAISESVKRDICESGFYEKKVVLIYNGVDIKKFKVSKKTNIVKKVICVARLYPEKKGQDILIRAVSELKKRGLRLQCFLVGAAPNELPQCTKDVNKMIKELNVEDMIFVLGNRDDVPDLLSSSDIFVLPSRYEGFGISIIEAMFSMVPVLASDIDGPKEIIKEERYGRLFKSGDWMDLANKLEAMIKEDNKLMAEAAYAYALCNYSIEAMNVSLDELYLS